MIIIIYYNRGTVMNKKIELGLFVEEIENEADVKNKILIIGSGNAAMTAGIAALENGCEVEILEKAPESLSGGNTKYTAGAMRFCFNGIDDLFPLLKNLDDDRLKNTEFGSYSPESFSNDLLSFNDGRPLSDEQIVLVDESYDAMRWLSGHNIKFDPIYDRQSFEKEGKHVFWGGLALSATEEGIGLFEQERDAFLKLGGKIRYETEVTSIAQYEGKVCGVYADKIFFKGNAVVLATGGFEANENMRAEFVGENWRNAKVRGTPHNTGDGLRMAFALGAKKYGVFSGCHATPMDLNMPDFGGLDLPPIQRKLYRKICYFLGIMVNIGGQRFVDEGENFRNYTYAQFGRKVIEQPKSQAWQIFDSKVMDLLYDEYTFEKATFVEASSLDSLTDKMINVDKKSVLQTIADFNLACSSNKAFDPTVLDGKKTSGLALPKSNWAQPISDPPFRAYPVTGGITFTYGGLKITNDGSVLSEDDSRIPGLFACGELVGGVFFNGYPGGSGLTSGLVFGRIAGLGASRYSKEYAKTYK